MNLPTASKATAVAVALLISAVAGPLAAAPVAADGTFVSITVDTSTNSPVPESEFSVTPTLRNANDSDEAYVVDSVEVRKTTDRTSKKYAERTSLGRLDPGDTLRPNLNITLNETGAQTVYVHAELRGFDGDTRRIVHPLDVTVQQPHPQLEVSVEEAVVGAERGMNVTVANGLNDSVRQVRLSLASENVEFREADRVAATLGAGETRTFSFAATAEAGEKLPMRAVLTYTDPDGERRRSIETFEADFRPPENPGTIDLTGVSVESDGSNDRVSISGSAANLGGERVDSVVVSVVGEENVAPAQPQPEYFVGTVESSDFVSFDLDARLTNNRTEIPIRVRYTVDGVTQETVTTVNYEPETTNDANRPNQSGSSLPLVGGLVVVFVVVGGLVLWRRG
ncbi:hypothetical protein AUR64_18210 [Haloprofundus marisrubri]|uniref:CARDB domain-containing protein n=1 Tax=Haloprofundus marisrubri TaxID=1514971 RepID=A0A0W1R5R7_9EURY|nr:hypothetical protein [Haloprofundus marisrubri]KTG08603.1 hypothetical protein AUR64_18210 [Haloprofundus marisrubri]